MADWNLKMEDILEKRRTKAEKKKMKILNVLSNIATSFKI